MSKIWGGALAPSAHLLSTLLLSIFQLTMIMLLLIMLTGLQEGMTPLLCAVSNNKEDVAVMLIEKYNASPFKTDLVRMYT